MDFNALQQDLADAAAIASGGGGGGGGGSSGHHSHHSAHLHHGSNSQHPTIYQHYEFIEELGRGAYGAVMKARKRDSVGGRAVGVGGRRVSTATSYGSVSGGGTGALSSTGASSSSATFYAVKIIDKKKAGSKGLSEVMGEVETLRLLNHPNIVHLEEIFNDDSTLYIVMEYVPGGELHKVLKRLGSVPEATARQIIVQLLLAVEYIHQKGIVHRDLKPANMLLKDEQEWQIKIADFGFAVLVGQDNCLQSYCGTQAYMAPEIVLDMNYGRPVDIWAVGVILYLLISGEYPFSAASAAATNANIGGGGGSPAAVPVSNGGGGGDISDAIVANRWAQNPHPKMQNASPGARDFIGKLLTSDPAKRITAREALKHTWIQTALQGLSHRLEAAAAGNGGRGGGGPQAHRVPPLTRFRSWVWVVVASHRLVYWRKLRVLKHQHAGDIPLLRSFSFLVTGKYEPVRGVINASGAFLSNPKAVASLLMPMVEASVTVDTLDLSENGIDSVDVIQGIVKSIIAHPSLTTLILDSNPIPPLAGRGLVRLARASTNRIRTLRLHHTQIGNDVLQQVASALKDKKFPESSSLVVQQQQQGLTVSSSHNTPSPIPPPSSSYPSSSSQQRSAGVNSSSGGGPPVPPGTRGNAPGGGGGVSAAISSSRTNSGLNTTLVRGNTTTTAATIPSHTAPMVVSPSATPAMGGTRRGPGGSSGCVTVVTTTRTGGGGLARHGSGSSNSASSSSVSLSAPTAPSATGKRLPSIPNAQQHPSSTAAGLLLLKKR